MSTYLLWKFLFPESGIGYVEDRLEETREVSELRYMQKKKKERLVSFPEP